MTAISNHGQIARHEGPVVIAERIRSSFERLAEAIRRHYRAQVIVAELEAYSDRELADLGMSRHDIRRIARQSVASA